MKQKIKEQIFKKHFNSQYATVRASDLPKDIQENDIIEIRSEDAFFSENNSYDAYTELVVFREREETDEEYQKRLSNNKKANEELKKRRYETYLKLKKEFEEQKED